MEAALRQTVRLFRSCASAQTNYQRTFSRGLRNVLLVKPATQSEPRRTGVIAMKCGMMPLYDAWGVQRVVTVLKLENCQVVQVKTESKEGHNALQIGSGLAKTKNVPKPQRLHFEKAGVPYKRYLAEFRVSPDALVPVGTKITAKHFIVGQFVDVQGFTIGKGFQGVMKRWDFKGLPASHGVSRAHRSHGSTGNRQDPGRVRPGMKMAGHMGFEKRTIQNLKVYQIDPDRDLLFIEGQVPGKRGSMVRVTDAIKKCHSVLYELPYPTHIPAEDEIEQLKTDIENGKRYIVEPPAEKNPLERV